MTATVPATTSFDLAPADADLRVLARPERIGTLSPIPGADAIEAAAVRGWQVVVRKGEFTVGDPVVFFEIDAALPLEDPRFAFLGARGTKTIPVAGVDRDVHVLKTARLRGAYSQGLVLPADQFTSELAEAQATGADLATLLGVVKYEPPAPAGMAVVGPFPSMLRKTDAERVQNLDEVTWAAIVAEPGAWAPVEKVDGSSLTAWRDHDGTLRVASRNWELDPGTRNAHWDATAAVRLEELLAPGEYVQAEVAGPGVQGNPLRLPALRLFVFTFGELPDPAAGGSATRVPAALWPAWVRDLAAPVYDFTLPGTVAETVAQVEKLTSLVAPGRVAEGVVWTRRDAAGVPGLDGRHVFKSISAHYLLKH